MSTNNNNKVSTNVDSDEDEAPKEVKQYTPRHPELFRYEPRFIDPVLLAGGDVKTIVREEVEQIYRFQLFTPEFCKLMISEAENCAKWHTEDEVFVTVNINGRSEVDDPETTLHLWEMPPMEQVFYEIVEKHIKPVAEGLWKSFKLQKKDRPYILKYEPDVISQMGLHYDNETVTIVVTLSDPTDYEGGGTFFPRWNYSTGKPAAGTCIIYPGGVSHEHKGLKITAGRRYLFLCAFY
eukprot:TRINITY_DN25_c0_g2_i1.p1 TRINITY_DN25_c0_g2~~TRINITY_DN25_c0_g2_i1.p1  ORF type:complete len:237 (-),score=112.72 TRINITY_DN25_c0_g2_i1:185-895(-)